MTIIVSSASGAAHGDYENIVAANLMAMATVNLLGSLVNIAIMVFFGVNGNAWREKNLLARAYELRGTVVAANDEAALSYFMGGTKPGGVRQ